MGLGSGPTGVDEAWESRVGVIGRFEGDKLLRPGDHGAKKVLDTAHGTIFQTFLTRNAR